MIQVKGHPMRTTRLLLVSVVLWCLSAAPGKAHFLFIHIGPPAEAGRAAEVFFSERAEAGDPRFIDKVAHTQLWQRDAGGKVAPLAVQKGADRLRAYLPPSGSIVVAGVCEYGVLARPMQTPFLLRYFPKAIAGNPDELNRMQPMGKTPLEIVARVEGDQLSLVALRDGKPVPKAIFHTVDADLANEKLTAGPDGRAIWKPATSGRYSVYTRSVLKTAGEAGGKKYDEIREFATLALVWPLERKEADPEAVARFQEAIAARAQWTGFPGFRAQIAGRVDDRPFEGTATVDASGKVRLETDEPVVRRWVTGQLESIAMHRGAGAEAAADQAKPVLRFGEEREDHPFGRLLIFDEGRFASSYRVKDKQILVVNRHMGKNTMTITVLDNERNPEGHFLPRSYTVQYWDAATGALRRTESVHERWQRVGAWDLPATHTVTVASDAGLAVRSFTLTEHELLKSNAGAKVSKTAK
jgi:hypothetical protein